MKVRIISSAVVLSGAQLRRGAVMDLADEVAKVLIGTHQAEPVESQAEKSQAKAVATRSVRSASKAADPSPAE